MVWRRKKKLDTARDFFKESAEKWEAALGPEHVDIAIPMRNLAEVLYDRGDLEQSVPLYERVLEIRERAYGPEHSLLSPPLYQLGRVLLKAGDPEAAEPVLRCALKLGRDRSPHRQLEILWPRIYLGHCLIALERYGEAEEVLRSNIGAEEVTPEILRWTRAALCDLYDSAGRPAEAARQRRALEELVEAS